MDSRAHAHFGKVPQAASSENKLSGRCLLQFEAPEAARTKSEPADFHSGNLSWWSYLRQTQH